MLFNPRDRDPIPTVYQVCLNSSEQGNTDQREKEVELEPKEWITEEVEEIHEDSKG